MDYTDLYNFKTDNGIIVPEDSAVLLGAQQKFQEIFGADIDLSAETPVGRLIETFAVMIKSALGVTAQSANQFNMNEATGIYLDSLAQMFNIRRIAETKTQVRIRCYFSKVPSGTTTIPAGSLIMASTTGDIFMVDEAIPNNGDLVDENGRVYNDGTATATRGGTIVVADGAVNTIQTSILGWSGVTNLSTIHTGTDLESDEELRRRMAETRFIGGGFYESLLSALKRLSGVNSVCILENNTGTDMLKKGVPIPPHSIYVGIDFIDTQSLIEQIANAIAKAKPIGVGMVNSEVNGATLVTWPVRYGYANESSQTICFYKPLRTPIHCSITFSANSYSTIDIAKQIMTATAEYMGTIGVGGTVSSMAMSNYISSKLGVFIHSIWLQRDENSSAADLSLEMMGYEIPFTSPSYINLTQKMNT